MLVPIFRSRVYLRCCLTRGASGASRRQTAAFSVSRSVRCRGTLQTSGDVPSRHFFSNRLRNFRCKRPSLEGIVGKFEHQRSKLFAVLVQDELELEGIVIRAVLAFTNRRL